MMSVSERGATRRTHAGSPPVLDVAREAIVPVMWMVSDLTRGATEPAKIWRVDAVRG